MESKEGKNIPGTSKLIDVSHQDDPLRWTRPRKYLALLIVCFWVMVLGAATTVSGVQYTGFMREFGITVDYLNIATAISILLCGLANFIFNPIAISYGRKSVYLLSALLSFISQIMISQAPNKQVLTAGRILVGFAAGPFEQLPVVSVDDQFFVHRRGLGLSFYIISINVGSFLGPMCAGFITQYLGWRWVNHILAILTAFAFVLILVGLEETSFPQRNVINGAPISTENDNEEAMSLDATCADFFWKTRKPVTVIHRPGMLWHTMFTSVRLVFTPIIFWSGIVYGTAISCLSIMSVTLSTVFMSPIYNFTPSETGLTNIAGFLGSIFTIYIDGAATDRFLVWKARRNQGIMHAESRLYPLLTSAPIIAAGLLLYGVGTAREAPWIVPVIGIGLIGAGLPIMAGVSLGYTAESYPLLAGEATSGVILIRNCIGCGITFAIAPWVSSAGLQNCFIEIGVIALVINLSAGLMIWKGKHMRKRSTTLYHRLLGFDV